MLHPIGANTWIWTSPLTDERLAQLAPGGTLHFARCSLDAAAELRRQGRARLDAALHGIAWEYGS